MSSLLKSSRLRGVTVAGVVVAALAIVIPQAGSAPTGKSGTAAASQQTAAEASGIPTFVHLPTDQAAHPSTTFEWWYTVGHVSSHGHEYGYVYRPGFCGDSGGWV
jgi:predicted secreted hydrolase